MKAVAASRPKRSPRAADLHETQETSKLDLEIEVRDFGPIRRGKISLKPLTVFVGPNNSGKSYAAMLIHSVLNALHGASKTPPQGSPAYDGSDEYLTALKKSGRRLSHFDPPPERVDLIAKKMLTNAIENFLPSELSRNFDQDLRSLVRKGSKSFSVSVRSEIAAFRVTSAGATLDSFTKQSKPENGSDAPPTDGLPGLPTDERAKKLMFHMEGMLDQLEVLTDSRSLHEAFKHSSYALVAERLGRFVAGPSLYLPSSRTGILQGHKAISAGMVRGAPSVGPRESEVPSLSGVVADFIQNLLTLPAEKKSMADIAAGMESELAGCEICAAYGSGKPISDIKRGEDLTLRAASSAVSELAPLVLYVRHVLDAGSVLILEEPEAHLHPANQRLLARFLARLVRRGLNVIVITHSPFVLEQLSHSVQASALSSSARAKYAGSKDAYLRAEEVAAYAFANGPQGGGISPILASERDGISQEEFIKVDDAMYDELMDIESMVP